MLILVLYFRVQNSTPFYIHTFKNFWKIFISKFGDFPQLLSSLHHNIY